MSGPRILVADDDPRLREVVRYTLSRQGWEVLEAADGASAVAMTRADGPDLVVLDVLMPEMDGLEACRTIRTFSSVPIIFLSSRDEEMDKILGLELGADDYLAKPFSTRELVSRVKALFRRVRPAEVVEDVLQQGGVRVFLSQHRCVVGEREVDLTATEFRILATLLRHPGRVYTREELMERAYPDQRFVSERTMDSHLRNVRAKLRDAGVDPIETVHGVGFRLRGT